MNFFFLSFMIFFLIFISFVSILEVESVLVCFFGVIYLFVVCGNQNWTEVVDAMLP